MWPGTALMTRSCFEAMSVTVRGSDKSARSGATALLFEKRLNAWALMSTAVTLIPLSPDRSTAMGPPTNPEPNTAIFFMGPPWIRMTLSNKMRISPSRSSCQ